MRPRILCGLVLVIGCTADPVASEPASWNAPATPGREPPRVAISSAVIVAQVDRPAYAITIDHDNVYFTTDVASSIETRPTVVWQCSKDGCDAATPIGSGHAMPSVVVVDASNVYWLAGSPAPLSIQSCPIGGCGDADPRVVTFQDPILDLASDGASIYWLGNGGVVSSCDGSNCDATTRVVISPTDAIQIGVDTTNLWFRNFVDESIVRCTVSDCGPTQTHVATNFAFAPFALDQTNVYFRTPAGIAKCAKSGCRKPSVIAPLDKDANVTDIVADGSRVYWIDRQSVETCPITGCARPFVVSAAGVGLKTANHLAIDDHFVYWTAGAVLETTLSDDKVEHHGPGAVFRAAK